MDLLTKFCFANFPRLHTTPSLDTAKQIQAAKQFQMALKILMIIMIKIWNWDLREHTEKILKKREASKGPHLVCFTILVNTLTQLESRTLTVRQDFQAVNEDRCFSNGLPIESPFWWKMLVSFCSGFSGDLSGGSSRPKLRKELAQERRALPPSPTAACRLASSKTPESGPQDWSDRSSSYSSNLWTLAVSCRSKRRQTREDSDQMWCLGRGMNRLDLFTLLTNCSLLDGSLGGS